MTGVRVTPDARVVRLGMAPRRPELSFRAFQHHWSSSHADVVKSIPGLSSYIQLRAVLENGQPLVPYAGFDACSLLTFPSLDVMEAAFSSMEFRGAVQDDEREFIEKEKFTGVLGRWIPFRGGDPTALAGVHLVSLIRAPTALSADDLAQWGETSALRGGLIISEPAMHNGRFPAAVDVVEFRKYESSEDALIDLPRRSAAISEYASVSAWHLAIATPVFSRPPD